ncbi:hypothetical protein CISIN_1g0060002mg, partial [Citrus sinensis]
LMRFQELCSMAR